MRNIEIADANILLRYLLKDIPEHFAEACEILENRSVWVPGVVIAEVVYVLEKVYKVPRIDIQHAIETLSVYKNIHSKKFLINIHQQASNNQQIFWSKLLKTLCQTL